MSNHQLNTNDIRYHFKNKFIHKFPRGYDVPLHPEVCRTMTPCTPKDMFKNWRKDANNFFPDRRKILNMTPTVDYRFVQQGIKMYR